MSYHLLLLTGEVPNVGTAPGGICLFTWTGLGVEGMGPGSLSWLPLLLISAAFTSALLLVGRRVAYWAWIGVSNISILILTVTLLNSLLCSSINIWVTSFTNGVSSILVWMSSSSLHRSKFGPKTVCRKIRAFKLTAIPPSYSRSSCWQRKTPPPARENHKWISE